MRLKVSFFFLLKYTARGLFRNQRNWNQPRLLYTDFKLRAKQVSCAKNSATYNAKSKRAKRRPRVPSLRTLSYSQLFAIWRRIYSACDMRSRSGMRQFKKKKNEPMNWKRRIKVNYPHDFSPRIFYLSFPIFYKICLKRNSKIMFRAGKVQIRPRLQNQRVEKANRATRARDSRQSRTNSRDGVWVGALPQVKHTARTGAYRNTGFYSS